MSGCYALLVAAGRGHRAGRGLPKQYRPVGNRPVLRHTAERFCKHPAIDGVLVVTHPDDLELYEAAVSGLTLLPPGLGGKTRQESVFNGLKALEEHQPDCVLIHDAARPFIDAETITRLIDAIDVGAGAIAALAVVDTLKRAQAGKPAETLDRTDVWRAQTPQSFRYADILKAHQRAEGLALTDDAAVAEHSNMTINFVEGSEENFKITTESDFKRAERIVNSQQDTRPRTGFGYDVHKLGPGDHVWLCGIQIDHDLGLIGHSDADVGLHALTDAILGALADGDIGAHFPDSDPRWKGASSDRFLAHAAGLVRDRGGVINHVDVTLVCEKPRIRPHHETMVARVAQILDIKTSQVSIKATTTEKLGFTGRGEGIAAQAVATIMLPNDDG